MLTRSGSESGARAVAALDLLEALTERGAARHLTAQRSMPGAG
jgi:hypothetical protein